MSPRHSKHHRDAVPANLLARRRWKTEGWSPVSTVAVALCNYNHGKYLDGCLRAIVTQSRPADQIVIVDDGSTDDSKDIILNYAARHPTISAYFNGVNQGVMTSLKRA